jgi:small subunit ribosomal protein S16
VAVKIKLKRLGKMRHPQYRIVVADARTKRDGRAIEEIGKYHPKEDPSLIEVDSQRVQYWLGVGAQPTEAVAAILRVTGDWQTFKGLPGSEGTLRSPAVRPDRKAVFEAAAKEAAGEPKSEATTARARKPKAEAAAPAAKSGAENAPEAAAEATEATESDETPAAPETTQAVEATVPTEVADATAEPTDTADATAEATEAAADAETASSAAETDGDTASDATEAGEKA